MTNLLHAEFMVSDCAFDAIPERLDGVAEVRRHVLGIRISYA